MIITQSIFTETAIQCVPCDVINKSQLWLMVTIGILGNKLMLEQMWAKIMDDITTPLPDRKLNDL